MEMETNNKRIGIYVRVSTREQAEEGYSIGAQLEKLRAYCEIKSWKIAQEYVDAGFSGGKLERPEIQRLIKDVQAHKIDLVLVYKLDRLSRSQKDTLYLIEDIFHPNGVKFSSLQENFDTSTPLGMAMVGILSVFAQLERAQIRERMALGAEARANEGLWHGGGFDPFGYDYVPAQGIKGSGRLVINEYEALQIRQIYDMFESGASISQIQKFMQSKYKNKYGAWANPSLIYTALETPVCAGMIKTKVGYIKGQHEPIIPIERFEKVQALLKARRKNLTSSQKSAFSRTSLLAGLLFCGNCGARYYIKTVNSGTKPTTKKLIRYYYCYSRGKCKKTMIIDPNCKNIAIREEQLDQIIIDEICKLQIYPDKVDEIPDIKPSQELIDKKIAELEAKKKKLIDLYILDQFSIDEIRDRIEDIKDQIKVLEDEKLELVSPIITIEEAKEKLINAKEIFESGTFEEKVSLVHALIEQIIIFNDKIEIHWTFE